jgi:hypothetical protein
VDVLDRVLPKQLAEDIKEGSKHKTALAAFTEGLESSHLGEVEEWCTWVGRWEGEQHTDPKDSLFDYKEAG